MRPVDNFFNDSDGCQTTLKLVDYVSTDSGRWDKLMGKKVSNGDFLDYPLDW